MEAVEQATNWLEVEADEIPRTVVALGKNWHEHDHRRLSDQSIQTTFAAFELARSGMVDTIIFSSGDTAGHGLSEAEAMCGMFLRMSHLLPEDIRRNLLLVIEPNSLETSGNAEEVEKITRLLQTPAVGLLTVDDHMDRATGFSLHYGLPVARLLVTEEIIQESANELINSPDPDLQKIGGLYFQCLLSTSQTHNQHQREQHRELLYRFIQAVDPFGGLPWLITRTTRQPGRMHNGETDSRKLFSQHPHIDYREVSPNQITYIDIQELMEKKGLEYNGPFVVFDPLDVNADTTFLKAPPIPWLWVRTGDRTGKTILKVMAVSKSGELVSYLIDLKITDEQPAPSGAWNG